MFKQHHPTVSSSISLLIFVQLQHGFGWEAFRTVFAGYKDLCGSERPKTEEEKHSQFMVRFSKAAHKNLGPFFLAWACPFPRKPLPGSPVDAGGLAKVT